MENDEGDDDAPVDLDDDSDRATCLLAKHWEESAPILARGIA